MAHPCHARADGVGRGVGQVLWRWRPSPGVAALLAVGGVAGGIAESAAAWQYRMDWLDPGETCYAWFGERAGPGAEFTGDEGVFPAHATCTTADGRVFELFPPGLSAALSALLVVAVLSYLAGLAGLVASRLHRRVAAGNAAGAVGTALSAGATVARAAAILVLSLAFAGATIMLALASFLVAGWLAPLWVCAGAVALATSVRLPAGRGPARVTGT